MRLVGRRALAAAAVGIGITGVVAAPAHAQLPPPTVTTPPVTTPPVDLSVPSLGIEVHVPGQTVVGEGGVGAVPPVPPGVPGVPGVPGAPAAPSTSGAPGSAAPSAGSPAGAPPAAPAPAPDAPAPETPPPADPTTPAPGSAPPSGGGSGSAQAAGAPSGRGGSGGGSPTLGSAIAGAITEPVTLVSALTLALGLGVVVGAAPYLPRYRRRQRSLLEQWARASAREHAAAEKLAETDRQKSEFLALVSHELRTPLTAVKGFVDTVLLHWDRLPEERRRDLLTRASSNADELGRLVGQLMEFARSDTGPIEIVPTELDVRDAVDGALHDLAPVVADHSVTVDVPDGLAVDADADAFNHVLVNLLTNAVKFSPLGSRVIVRAIRDADDVVVSVSDEGAGIPREDQDRIFDRYYQSANGNGARGTGIGLTIAQRFTELHGGRIWVESEPGRGATFSFTMPTAAVALVS
jgi:signal transduction histidine kinase